MKKYLAAIGIVFVGLLAGCAVGREKGLVAGDVPTKVMYLSGKGKDDGVPWKFVCSSGMKAGVESTIMVPSNWELQGFGTFTYGYEHRGSRDKPGVPIVGVEGKYSRTFVGPSQEGGQRTFLVFEGVMTDTAATINGQSVGAKHQGGFYRFKYEVTSLVKAGQENQLGVVVDDESANASVNNAERRGDFFNYGGIYRPVYLETVPREFIDRVAVDARADGSFKLDAYTDGVAAGDEVEGQFYDVKGKAIGGAFSAAVGADGKAHLESAMSDAKLWTAETPNLYLVDVRLKKGGVVVHSMEQRFGFRTIEVRDGEGLYVNGKRIWLKGSDRHSFWPDSGRCTSEAISRLDINLMHEMNMNAVRMSHYPPDQHFLDDCDEMGLYVLDEVTGWHGAYDDEVGHKVVKETVTRDVNHPSVLFWDNGNEGGWNVHLDGDYAQYDPQGRHVLHPWAIFDHVDTKHYPDFKTLSDKANGANVFFPTEMLHGLYDGGAGAGLAEYWDVMREGKVGAGGFIWAFLDEAPKRVDLDGHLDTRGNLAPDGIVGPYREKEGSFYTIKEIWAPVVITEKEMPGDGVFHVENRYSFTNLNDCHFSYQLRKFKSPGDKEAGFDVIPSPTGGGSLLQWVPIKSPDVKPGGNGVLEFGLAKVSEDADALVIRIENPNGEEIFTPVFTMSASQLINRTIVEKQVMANGITSVSDNLEAVTVTGVNGLKLTFSKATGYLASVENGGKSFSLTNGPRLVSGDAKLVSIHGEYHTQGDVVATVTATYSGDLKSVVWSVHQNGWVDVEADYARNGPTDFVGVGFDYPEKEVKSIRYLGKGPYRMYENRTAGPTLNVWENAYNDTETGAIPWKYPEFKGYFGDVRWARYETTEGAMTFLVDQPGLYLQNFVPSFPDKALVGKTQVSYPGTSIGFLQLIPPVGTKFGAASTMGPGSQEPVGKGEYRVKVSMYFGEFRGK